MHLAHGLIARTRIYHQLRGYRGVPGAHLDSIALTLIKVAQIAIDIAEVAELDINPLLADEYGVIALDARVKVSPVTATDRLAIRPYPKGLEEDIRTRDGRTLLLRPIRPEDEPMLQAGFQKLTAEEIRLRFFIPLKILNHVMAARATQIDYDREMALVLTEHGIAGKTEIYGMVQITSDPDLERAEFAILVRHDMTGQGLGKLLMQRLIDYARGRGIREVFGDVLAENTVMRRLCQGLGFTAAPVPGEHGIIRCGSGSEATLIALLTLTHAHLLEAKNSRKRSCARSPAAAIRAGHEDGGGRGRAGS